MSQNFVAFSLKCFTNYRRKNYTFFLQIVVGLSGEFGRKLLRARAPLLAEVALRPDEPVGGDAWLRRVALASLTGAREP